MKHSPTTSSPELRPRFPLDDYISESNSSRELTFKIFLGSAIYLGISLLMLNFLYLSINSASAQTQISLPNSSDWVTRGTAIRAGSEGQWDRILWGGFSNNLIKKGSIYYLYYQGSPYYDNACESVAYRAIGVATSSDGINWTKHTSNPVIEWSSRGSIEEGAASSGVWLGNDGKIYIYYGANTGSGCTVNAAGRLAVSNDGINFTDMGQVISPTNSNIWGYGDELFPVGGYEYNGKWNVYYIPNGTAPSRKLGVVTGSSSTNLTSSSAVNSGNLSAWGTVSTVINGVNSFLFVNDPGTNLPINAYSFNPSSPSIATLQKSYIFSDCARSSVMADLSQSRWLMLCREKTNADSYIIKTAQFPGTVPTNSPTPTSIPTLTPTRIPTFTSTPTLNPLPGDINGDRIVNLQDYILLSNAFGTSNIAADINKDGIVNLQDYVLLSNNFGRTN